MYSLSNNWYSEDLCNLLDHIIVVRMVRSFNSGTTMNGYCCNLAFFNHLAEFYSFFKSGEKSYLASHRNAKTLNQSC